MQNEARILSLFKAGGREGAAARGSFSPGYEGAPKEIIERLNKEINAGLADGGIDEQKKETVTGTSPLYRGKHVSIIPAQYPEGIGSDVVIIHLDHQAAGENHRNRTAALRRAWREG